VPRINLVGPRALKVSYHSHGVTIWEKELNPVRDMLWRTRPAPLRPMR